MKTLISFLLQTIAYCMIWYAIFKANTQIVELELFDSQWWLYMSLVVIAGAILTNTHRIDE